MVMHRRTASSAIRSDPLETAGPGGLIRPTATEIPYVDPLRAFAVFADAPMAILLDSAAEGNGRGRYSYIATDPVASLSLSIGDPVAGPFDTLRGLIGRRRLHADPNLPPFQTGVCGILGYELSRAVERLPTPKAGTAFPDLVAGLYDTVVAFDTFTRRAWVVATDLDPARPSATRRRAALADAVVGAAALPDLGPAPGAAWTWELDRAGYEAAVKKTIDYIYAGDIFQANITARAHTPMPGNIDPFTIYRRLRWASPAPFAAYVHVGDGRALLSASPERFLALDRAGRIATRPIKGTRPRGDNPDVDAALATALAASEKDRAENLMIVDLLRNDISRVAMIGSVDVTALHELETFANVHHLVSEVVGKLRPGCDAVDLLRASFPGGSVTGAPKIRAMEIIHDLEPVCRGPYCGSVFWAGLDGAMDSSIVIRSLVIADDTVYAHAGGGIVADSDPADEYREMRLKADALLSALSGGEARDHLA